MSFPPTHTELARLIDGRLRGNPTVLENLRPGLTIARVTEPIPRIAAVYPTVICFLAQGCKVAHVGDRAWRYDAGQFLLSTMSVPADTEVVDATPEKPMLSLVLNLDLRRLGRVVNEVGECHPTAIRQQAQTAVAAFPFEPLLADAVYRLARTATRDEEWCVLGEGALDEVYYRLVSGESGGLLRERLARGGLDQIGRAISFIEDNLTKPLDVEAVARFVGMSSSGFHARFKEATSQSPMQFVKRMRLNAARNSLLEGLSVTEVAFSVGYSSASQFSREFSRQYGMPPSKVAATQPTNVDH